MSAWLVLKEEGTSHFQSKSYSSALTAYQCALDALLPLQPRDSFNLAVLESNISATCYQLGKYKDALDAAQRAIEYDTTFLKAHLRKAIALEALATKDTATTAGGAGATTTDQAKQKSAYLQEAITIVQKLRTLCDSTSSAAASSSTAGASAARKPSITLAEVNSTLTRLRDTITRMQVTYNSPSTYLTRLREQPTARDIKSTMQLIVQSGTARQEAYQNGVLEVLVKIMLNEELPKNTRAAAVKAVRHLLGTDISMSGTTSQKELLDLKSLSEAVPTLLKLFAASFAVLQTEAAKQQPSSSASSSSPSFLLSLINLLSRVAVHPRLLFSFTRDISTAFSKTIPRFLSKSINEETVWKGEIVTVIQTCIDSMSFIASAPGISSSLATALRRDWLPLLLLSPLIKYSFTSTTDSAVSVRSACIGCIATLTKTQTQSHRKGVKTTNDALNKVQKMFGKGMNDENEDGAEMSEKEKEVMEAEGREIKSDMLALLYTPLITGLTSSGGGSSSAASTTRDASSSVSSSADTSSTSTSTPASVEVSMDFEDTMTIIRGLSLLLQSNILLGIYVISYGENEQAASASATKAATSDPSVPPPPASEPKPTILQLLLSLSSYLSSSSAAASSSLPAPPRPLQLLSSEVLALACSDSHIRSTIVALSKAEAEAEAEELRAEGLDPIGMVSTAKGAHVFLDLILQFMEKDGSGGVVSKKGGAATNTLSLTPQATANSTVIAHALLALSKLIAVGEWAYPVQPVSATPTASASSSSGGAAGAPAALPSTDFTSPTPSLDVQTHQELGLLMYILFSLLEEHENLPERFGAGGSGTSGLSKEEEVEKKKEERKKRKEVKRAQKKKDGNEDIDDSEDDEGDDITSSSASSSHRASSSLNLLHLLFESLSYLTLHYHCKRWIIEESDGEPLKCLVRIACGVVNASKNNGTSTSTSSSSGLLGPLSSSTLRYALTHIFNNLSTSRSSLTRALLTDSAEVNALKQAASKGLNKTGTSAGENNEQNQRAISLAGSDEESKMICQVMVRERCVKAMVELWKGYVLQKQEGGATTNKATSSSSSSSANKSSSTSSILPPSLLLSFVSTLSQLTSHRETRGQLVQQGGIRLLLDLYGDTPKDAATTVIGGVPMMQDETSATKGPTPSVMALSSLARVFISINPSLVPETLLPSVAFILLEGLSLVTHELDQFEILLALTNLASYRSANQEYGGETGGLDMPELICTGSKKVTIYNHRAKKDEIHSNNGWQLAKSLLVSDNIQIQRAALELMTNLVSASYVRMKIRNVPAELDIAEGKKKVTKEEHASSLQQTLQGDLSQNEDLKLFLAFSLSDDLPTQLAATGGLAMLSGDALIAKRIEKTRVISYVPIEDDGTEISEVDEYTLSPSADDTLHTPSNSRPIIRDGWCIVKKLMNDRRLNQDVKRRVEVLKKNLEMAGK